MSDSADDTGLQEEANRIGKEKLEPLVEELIEELDLKDTEGANKRLINALITALMEGIWLGAVHLAADIQTHHPEIQINLHKHFTDPDDEDEDAG